MGKLYEALVRRALFKLDPEHAHEHAVSAMALLGAVPPLCRALESWIRYSAPPARPIEALGLRFPNAIGLGAGFDKNGRAWPAAAALGFGHVEIGTVTARAQPGNPRPRVFRYPQDEAVINRMGFNNEGAAAVASRLARQAGGGARRIPLGINLGKSKVTEIENAAEDYLESFRLLADHADYLVLNVSSPNTPNLRQLQDETKLRELLGAVSAANRARSMKGSAVGADGPGGEVAGAAGAAGGAGATAGGKRRVPLLLKIAPDLSWPQIDAVLGVIEEFQLDGIVATNTTLERPGHFSTVNEAGGLSGAPLRRRATAIVNYISRLTAGRLPIIGVGGIMDAEGAAEKMDAGATLVQVYTGMIYRGPFFAAELARSLGDWQR